MLIGFARHQPGATGADDSLALQGMGCERIFAYETPHELEGQFNDMLDFCRCGDSVALVDLDRLGQTLPHILSGIARLDEKGIRIIVRGRGIEPGTPLGDNFAGVCRLLGTLPPVKIRDQVRRRGRPTALDDTTQEKALRLLSNNASVLEVARLLQVSPATIYRLFPRRTRKTG